jgi:hypothetical protein
MTEHAKRIALMAGAIALALLSIGAGALIALSDEDGRAGMPTSTPSGSPSGSTPTVQPSRSPEPSEQPETPEPSGESPILEDGTHFVYVTSASRIGDGSARVRFDLAYFYRGERAEQEAAERGDESVNDHYIVNDNPRLRTLPLADDVEVEYIPLGLCCDLQPGNIDVWLEAVLGPDPTDYGGTDVPWWFTVEGGHITRIVQQYLP